MKRPPDFDDLIGDVDEGERARLLRAHELLVAAGPPPELSPELEAGPPLALTLGPRRLAQRPRTRRPLLLAAAALVLAAAFVVGYASGNRSTDRDALGGGWVVRLHPPANGIAAQAALRVGTPDGSGNWPMHLVASGLPKLPEDGYYEVFLTRHGKIVAPCGSFIVKHGDTAEAYLNAPYRLRGAGWVVTVQKRGDHEPGRVVLTT